MFEIHQIARDKWREQNAKFKALPDIPAVTVQAPNALDRVLIMLRKALTSMKTTAAPRSVSVRRHAAVKRERG